MFLRVRTSPCLLLNQSSTTSSRACHLQSHSLLPASQHLPPAQIQVAPLKVQELDSATQVVPSYIRTGERWSSQWTVRKPKLPSTSIPCPPPLLLSPAFL